MTFVFILVTTLGGGAVKTLIKLVLAQTYLSLCQFYMCKVPKSYELAHLLLELILVTLIMGGDIWAMT